MLIFLLFACNLQFIYLFMYFAFFPFFQYYIRIVLSKKFTVLFMHIKWSGVSRCGQVWWLVRPELVSKTSIHLSFIFQIRLNRSYTNYISILRWLYICATCNMRKCSATTFDYFRRFGTSANYPCPLWKCSKLLSSRHVLRIDISLQFMPIHMMLNSLFR